MTKINELIEDFRLNQEFWVGERGMLIFVCFDCIGGKSLQLRS